MKFTKIVSMGLSVMGVLILIVALVGVLSSSTMRSRYQSMFEKEVELEHYSMLIENEMLQARRAEKDFILRKDTSYVAKHTSLVEAIIANASNIKELDVSSEYKGLAEKAATYASNYHSKFEEMVKGYINAGLTHEDGLQGSFRNSAHLIMEVTGTEDVRTVTPSLAEKILLVRRHEKDYLLRRSTKYVERTHAQMTEIKEIVLGSYLTDETKKTITETADKYLKDFDALVAEHKHIESTVADMREAIHQIEPLVEELALKADEQLNIRQEAVQSFSNVMISVILVVAALGIVIGIIIIVRLLSIVKLKLGAEPSVLENIAKEIARGNIHIDLSSYESFGNTGLFKEMNTMATEINTSIQLAEYISEGDISQESHFASDEDALGIALDKMTKALNHVVAGIRNASDQLDTSAEQVSDASQVIAESATEQAATIEQISASMVEIEKSASTNSENAKSTNTFAKEAEEAASRGSRDMELLRKTMDEVVESSNQVVKIIKVIDDIAFQTNLLALNAAVEAARAGQHGKGFAVVADEVRNLAARSAKAAQETAALITASNQGATRGAEMTSNTAEAFSSIVEKISDMGNLVASIAAGTMEQEDAIKEINTGLEQLGKAIQNNSATSEETAAASEEMRAQAAELNALIRFFKVREEIGTLSLPPLTHEPEEHSFMKKDRGVEYSNHMSTTNKDLDTSKVLSYDESPLEY